MKLSDIDLRKVYKMWKADIGPFQSFFRSTPFVSLQTYDDFELLEESEIKYDKEIIDKIVENLEEGKFIIVDLPFKKILNIALVLNNEYSIKPILNINLLFHPFGLVGSKDHISKLINFGVKLKKIRPEKFVMLIPYDRYIDNLEYESLKDKLNNQYAIGEGDLPYSYMIKELGFNKMVILTQEIIKEDMKDYVSSINKDLEIEIIKVM